MLPGHLISSNCMKMNKKVATEVLEILCEPYKMETHKKFPQYPTYLAIAPKPQKPDGSVSGFGCTRPEIKIYIRLYIAYGSECR